MFSNIMNYLSVFKQDANDNKSKKDDDYFENHHFNVIRTLKQSQFINCYDTEDADIQRISNQIARMFIHSLSMYPETDYIFEEIDILNSLYFEKNRKFRELFSKEIGEEEYGLKIYKGEAKKTFQRIYNSIIIARKIERLREVFEQNRKRREKDEKFYYYL